MVADDWNRSPYEKGSFTPNVEDNAWNGWLCLIRSGGAAVENRSEPRVERRLVSGCVERATVSNPCLGGYVTKY
ncbi:hypothetical protein RSOLAG1IB_11133 [Rhizoctonia solani AG-1 IB]|uniref:Uncharacterized protein n=1 Tax=Thanatephorus cucumeris (strain AG1-IB / isolate 7/3/14) TaxID=1108050 RepID=A0A0B7F794_THACB|nr:hypothetical protein RSOLAG1IB_11133 [Rhizoctonia solani AG-1 IB]